MKTYNPTYNGNPKQIKKAAQAIANARKPVFYIGGGAVRSKAEKIIRELVEITQIPTVETLMGLGIMDSSHPLRLGMVGMHGSYVANMSMSEADLMISLGARFDDRVTGKLSEFGKYAKIIHIDIDPSSIGKIVDIDYPIVGDLDHILKELKPILQKDVDPNRYATWRETLKKYKEIHPLSFQDSNSTIKPQWVISRVGELLKEKAVVVTDVGQHQMWTAQFYPFNKPRQFMTSGGLGTMGVGLPYAMGVKRANPDMISVNFTGDGSIMMNIQEIITCTQYNLPHINIVLNNNYLGMVRQWQTLFYEDRLAETVLDTQADFKMLCESMGGVGFRVTTKDEFDKALDEAVKLNKPTIIEVIIDRREQVLPMVPNGHALDEMLLLEGDK
jgi:acetolactate synthase-1/2/3 large subunit